MKLTFVTYHCDISKKAVHTIFEKLPILKENRWDDFLYLSRECIDLLFQSIKQTHPDCRCVIMTDRLTHLEAIEGVSIERHDVDPDQPAYMRLCAQIEHLKNTNPSHVIFLDYDMLVQHSLEPLFKEDFDIGLSYRQHPCPINGGLMIVPQKGKKQAISFLEKVKIYYEKHYPKNKDWGGFQGAISDVIEDKTIFSRKSDIITVHDTRILLLSDKTYNFTIGGEGHLVDYQPDKKILHFKGSRKKDMMVYWNEYLKLRT